MNMLKYRAVYYAISLVVLVAGLASVAINGLQLGIDFTGGSLLEVNITQSEGELTAEEVKETAAQVMYVSQVQPISSTQFLIKGEDVENATKVIVIDALSVLGQVEELRFETVGPLLSAELVMKTVWSVIIAAGCITIYVWRQFKDLTFGVCAVLAMLHDMLVVVGVFSILGWLFGAEVDVLFVTALLTTLTFSVHDTIIMYDRIRELRRKYPGYGFREVVNSAVLQTLSRSLNTSFTIIIMLSALAVIGGETIRWFVVALLIGAVTGTYSSPFVSVPLLFELHNWKNRKKT